MSNDIIIKEEEINALVVEGGKFLFQKGAEEALVKLLKFREIINTKIEEVEKQIDTAGKAINPNFKGVIGEKVRAVCKKGGHKFSYDKTQRDVAKPFLKLINIYIVDSDKVETYKKETNKVPDAIIENDRDSVTRLYLKDEENAD